MGGAMDLVASENIIVAMMHVKAGQSKILKQLVTYH
jgi:acyl CoA:acetate/3-ketoacid CoA transferase beta subunit